MYGGGSINIGGSTGGMAGKLVASGGSPTSWQGLQQRAPQQGLTYAGSGTPPGSPGAHYRTRQNGGSPRTSSLRPKLAAGLPGSPTAGQGRPWGIAGSPSSPTVLRSGSGMPGSPLIGARRPGSGL